jgi:hypothetical protein
MPCDLEVRRFGPLPTRRVHETEHAVRSFDVAQGDIRGRYSGRDTEARVDVGRSDLASDALVIRYQPGSVVLCFRGATQPGLLRFPARAYLSSKRGGLNGSTQHLLEAHAQGFQPLRGVRER